MPLPDRPVANTTIDSEWGQAVHDYTFAPSGCTVTGGVVTVSTSTTQLPIDTAVDDPGGFVDVGGDRIVIPADKDGLYALSLQADTVTGATTSRTRVYIRVNGAGIGQATDDNEGGTHVQLALNRYKPLTAGDIVTIHAIKLGTGTSPSVSIADFTIIRLGAELGA